MSDHESDHSEGEGAEEIVGVDQSIKRSKPLWRSPGGWNPSLLAFCRENHISWRPRSGMSRYQLRGYLAGAHIEDLFTPEMRNDPAFMLMWHECGFGPFMDSLRAMMERPAVMVVILGLLEWWWDTTNTFHMPWGEVTITPHDFAMLTGLSFTQRSVALDGTLTTRSESLAADLGPVVQRFTGRETSTVSRSTLLEGLSMPETTREQRLRIVLLLLIDGTLCAHKGWSTRVHLMYLASLRDLTVVHQFDWAGLSYGYLIHQMRLACRQVDCSMRLGIAGLWRVIEVCWLLPQIMFLFFSLSHVSDLLC